VPRVVPAHREADMPVKVEVSERMGAADMLAHVVKIGGSLDGDTVAAAEKAIQPVLAKPLSHVVFNLSDLTFISSAGISLLLASRKTLEAKKVSVGVVGMRAPIRKVFDIMKVLPAPQVFASVKEMDDYLATIQHRVAEGEA
jgi:anti-anti-sigma factor